MKTATKKALLATAVLTFMLSAPAFSQTESSTIATETPGGTIVKKTVTEVAPASTSTSTTTVTTTETAPATTKTEMHWSSEEHTAPTGARVINFLDFDLNRDGTLSLDEIGKMLFKLYDTDGNEIIDNKEYERKSVVTVMPMEKNTVISYDFDGDGKPDKTQYTYESFKQETLLSRFDANKDGLSPHEFTGRDFLAADVNRDAAIDLKEWQGSYISSIDASNKERARFNK